MALFFGQDWSFIMAKIIYNMSDQRSLEKFPLFCKKLVGETLSLDFEEFKELFIYEFKVLVAIDDLKEYYERLIACRKHADIGKAKQAFQELKSFFY